MILSKLFSLGEQFDEDPSAPAFCFNYLYTSPTFTDTVFAEIFDNDTQLAVTHHLNVAKEHLGHTFDVVIKEHIRRPVLYAYSSDGAPIITHLDD